MGVKRCLIEERRWCGRGNWLVIEHKGFRTEGKGRARPGRKGRLNTEVEKTERTTQRYGGRKKDREYHEKHLKKMDILIQVEFLKLQSSSSR